MDKQMNGQVRTGEAEAHKKLRIRKKDSKHSVMMKDHYVVK